MLYHCQIKNVYNVLKYLAIKIADKFVYQKDAFLNQPKVCWTSCTLKLYNDQNNQLVWTNWIWRVSSMVSTRHCSETSPRRYCSVLWRCCWLAIVICREKICLRICWKMRACPSRKTEPTRLIRLIALCVENICVFKKQQICGSIDLPFSTQSSIDVKP